MLGPHGRSQQIAAGTYVDPMRQVDELLDYEARAKRQIVESNRQIADAWRVVGLIESLGGDDAAQIVTHRYLMAEDWREIAGALGRQIEECRSLDARVTEWMDEVGVGWLIAHSREAS